MQQVKEVACWPSEPPPGISSREKKILTFHRNHNCSLPIVWVSRINIDSKIIFNTGPPSIIRWNYQCIILNIMYNRNKDYPPVHTMGWTTLYQMCVHMCTQITTYVFSAALVDRLVDTLTSWLHVSKTWKQFNWHTPRWKQLKENYLFNFLVNKNSVQWLQQTASRLPRNLVTMQV